MKIGDVARQSGASVRSIRHYERVGLIRAIRNGNGYRDFDSDSAQLVRRIRGLITLGFSTAEIAIFLPQLIGEASLSSDCSAVTAAHRAKLLEIERQIAELESRRRQLVATLASPPSACVPIAPDAASPMKRIEHAE